MSKPKQKEEIDLTELKKICKSYIDFVYSKNYHEDNDYTNYIFETAMQTIYGYDVFKQINKRTRDC